MTINLHSDISSSLVTELASLGYTLVLTKWDYDCPVYHYSDEWGNWIVVVCNWY